MKKHISTLLLAVTGLYFNTNAQVKPVDQSTFAGHYFTETRMVIVKGSTKKKSDEIDLTFDASTGLLSGVSPALPDNIYKLKFHADADNRKWAAETKVWFWANDNSNGTDYGKDMFDYNNMTLGTFIEEGVFVIFDASTKMDDKTKMFWAKMDAKNVRLMAKDKSKLSMDKLVAAQKAEDMINAAAGAQLLKVRKDQETAAMGVPDETLSKTDKALKAEVKQLLNSFRNSEDPSDMITAYTISNDWTINTNSLTGAILSREIIAEMILKNRNSGKCWRAPYTLVAQYNGSGYGKLAFKQKWNLTQCDCAQVEKNK